MDNFLTQFAQGGALTSATLALVAIAADRLWCWPAKWHPLTLVQLLARRMAIKVQTPVDAVAQQHVISGTLAYLVLFGPLLILMALLLEFAAYKSFFEGLLLYLTLGFAQVRKVYTRVITALAKKQKTLAREWLSQTVKRDTSSLSDIGVGKAAMESLLLRFFYQYVTVIFLFMVGGIVLAMTYRCALECRWQWKRPQAGSDFFVVPVTFFCRLCQWLPCAIMTLLLKLVIWPKLNHQKGREPVRVSPPKIGFWHLAPLIIRTFSCKLAIALSGPMYYQKIKVNLPRLGMPFQVRLSDMKATETIIELLSLVMSCLLIVLIAFSLYLTK
ncbi:cobalamin biosynthesis protein [Alteromonas sediminis]|uniref:cobalamin biosynthesis protein n=1 Tax=Alteromonas sediminis TaxID=2259342 RepID=UPI00140439CD|nr:cobalamin biosynthesis protein [Alteromonas sediminis]